MPKKKRVKFKSASIQFPPLMLAKIDANAKESRRSRSSEVVLLIERFYEALENP